MGDVIMRPLGSFGSEISGIDLSQTLDDVTVRTITDALFENHVLIIRRQQLDNAAYSRFGHLFGDPIRLFVPNQRDKERPELIWITNRTDTPERSKDAAMFWHADSTYETVPAVTTMLYALHAPEAGGETMFVDLAAAYDALSDEMKQRIEGLCGTHLLGNGPRDKNEIDNRTYSSPEADALREREQPIHPIVVRHPITGRTSLFAIAGHNTGIVGMEHAEAMALLAELKAHATAERFQLAVKCGAGDVMIWDNLSVLHAATPTRYTGRPEDRRELLRISTKGLPSIYGDDIPVFGERRVDA